MIRHAIPADKLRVVRLLKNAHAAAGLPFAFSAPHAAALFDAQAAPHRARIILDVDGIAQGVLMAAATDHPFAPIKVATEVVWWIEPAHRGTAASDMLAEYEAWAITQGCAFCGMAALEAAPRAGVIYRRRGYSPAEHHFIKALPLAA